MQAPFPRREYDISMPSRRALVLAVLSWLLASLGSAAISHGLIALVSGALLGGDAYATHEHAAVGPVVLAALVLAVTALFYAALQPLLRADANDPVALLARRFGSMNPLVPAVAVFAGSLFTLIAMEFAEQCAAFGRIEGVSDALGGNVALGIALVAIAAAVVTILGLRSARALLRGASAALAVLVAWVSARPQSRVDRATIAQRRRHCRHASTSAFLTRCLGLRAPPLPFA